MTKEREKELLLRIELLELKIKAMEYPSDRIIYVDRYVTAPYPVYPYWGWHPNVTPLYPPYVIPMSSATIGSTVTNTLPLLT